MKTTETLFTSEAVAPGHPDKLADRISDAILDEALRQNPAARVAAEVLVTRRLCVIAGEVSGAQLDHAAIARRVIAGTGYCDDDFGGPSTEYVVRVQEQSREISAAVDGTPEEGEGAGDQGIMFGFACDETPELTPATLTYAHAILRALQERRRAEPGLLGPDGKSQVTLVYRDGRPVRAHTVVVSHQHSEGAPVEELCRAAIVAALPAGLLDAGTRILVNPSGSFVKGGPASDTGLTGRKIIVDTYGGAAPHGGGAFSGKDPTKVDRSAAYAARWLAKNVVAAGLARRCTLQLAYAIGVAGPIALRIDTAGTGRVPDDRLTAAILGIAPLTPRWIRQRLKLDRPIYERTASHGHFGHAPEPDGGFSWEGTELVEALQRALG